MTEFFNDATPKTIRRKLGNLRTATEVEKAHARLIKNVYQERVDPALGATISQMLSRHLPLIKAGNMEQRLGNVEAKLGIIDPANDTEQRVDRAAQGANIEQPYKIGPDEMEAIRKDSEALKVQEEAMDLAEDYFASELPKVED